MDNYDYLKYWRVIRYFIKARYGLTQDDLDMLLFLNSENYFSKDKFDEFDELMSWNKNRFENLRQAGWIESFRENNGNRKAIYKISYKCKRMINSLYKKLNGEELPEDPKANPIFKRKVKYTDKVYRNYIIEMNRFIRQQRHRPPE